MSVFVFLNYSLGNAVFPQLNLLHILQRPSKWIFPWVSPKVIVSEGENSGLKAPRRDTFKNLHHGASNQLNFIYSAHISWLPTQCHIYQLGIKWWTKQSLISESFDSSIRQSRNKQMKAMWWMIKHTGKESECDRRCILIQGKASNACDRLYQMEQQSSRQTFRVSVKLLEYQCIWHIQEMAKKPEYLQ